MKKFILTVMGFIFAAAGITAFAMNTRAAKAKRILNRTKGTLYTVGRVMCVASGLEE